MKKKNKKIRLLNLKEVDTKISECTKKNQIGSAYYGHLKQHRNSLIK